MRGVANFSSLLPVMLRSTFILFEGTVSPSCDVQFSNKYKAIPILHVLNISNSLLLCSNGRLISISMGTVKSWPEQVSERLVKECSQL